MKILYVVDGRSPIAMNWIRAPVQAGHEVHLVSTFPYNSDIAFASSRVIGVGFSAGMQGGPSAHSQAGLLRRIPAGWRTGIRHWLAPLTLSSAARQLTAWMRQIQPELVHAMRIPYEGMLAARANPACPLIISVWGNDFTLHARSNASLARLTRETLVRADAVHADTQRDIHLARSWGWPPNRGDLVLPGAGGVQPELFFPSPGKHQAEAAGLEQNPLVINPRGVRSYVRNDLFFQAARQVINRAPHIRFVCPAMAGEPQIERWLADLDLHTYVHLLPQQTRLQMAALFQQALVAVSPSLHDGTPNTLLEAMACGCFPVAGDLESLREWIVPGRNGLLVNLVGCDSLAEAILLSVNDQEMRQRASAINQKLIAERASYPVVMAKALSFYGSQLK